MMINKICKEHSQSHGFSLFVCLFVYNGNNAAAATTATATTTNNNNNINYYQ